jgi:hypothetical protein
LAKRNVILVLWDINEQENRKTIDLLYLNDFHDAHMYTVDVSNKEDLEKTSKRVEKEVGHVYMVIMAG